MHLQRCTAHILRLIPPNSCHYPLEVVAFPFPFNYILTESVFTLKLPLLPFMYFISFWSVLCALLLSHSHYTFISLFHFSVRRSHSFAKGCLFNFCVTLTQILDFHVMQAVFSCYSFCVHSQLHGFAVVAVVHCAAQTNAQTGSMHALFAPVYHTQ